MKPYKDIFHKLEETLRKQSSFSEEKFNSSFGNFKHFENRKLTDNDYYNLIVEIVFYSGIKANIITNKMGTIKSYFNDYNEVCSYDKEKMNEILKDNEMIKNKKKIQACINNAKVLKEIIQEYGSFKEYISNFGPHKSFENLLLFKEEIQYTFDYFGDITSYHFMTDIGLPVLKPDRVITRIFRRIGLIENEKQLLKTVIQGRKFSKETELPIRYIDICFVKYGQMGKDETFGLDNGICLEKSPKCYLCGIKEYCNVFCMY